MIRRFNYTGRQTIARQHVHITLHRAESDAFYFDTELELSSYRFPREAQVRIEAWRLNSVQRWTLGTVGEVATLSQSQRMLRDVQETAQFRLAVVAVDGSGLVYGLTGPIRPHKVDTYEDGVVAESLLHVHLTAGLGQEVWKVEFGEGDVPVLQVNQDIPGIAEVVASDERFRALVMPEVLRAILIRAVVLDRLDSDDDEPDTWTEWISFASALLDGTDADGSAVPTSWSDRDDAIDWVESVVTRFACGEGLSAADTYRRAQGEAV